jgi:hypothetical protein
MTAHEPEFGMVVVEEFPWQMMKLFARHDDPDRFLLVLSSFDGIQHIVFLKTGSLPQHASYLFQDAVLVDGFCLTIGLVQDPIKAVHIFVEGSNQISIDLRLDYKFLWHDALPHVINGFYRFKEVIFLDVSPGNGDHDILTTIRAIDHHFAFIFTFLVGIGSESESNMKMLVAISAGYFERFFFFGHDILLGKVAQKREPWSLE